MPGIFSLTHTFRQSAVSPHVSQRARSSRSECSTRVLALRVAGTSLTRGSAAEYHPVKMTMKTTLIQAGSIVAAAGEKAANIKAGMNIAAAVLGLVVFAQSGSADPLRVYVSNERSGDVSIIDLAEMKVVRTLPVGKRPRGIHVSADAQTLYVATSGSPRMGPGADPERATSLTADKSADGVAIVDLSSGEVRHLKVGSDPEELALTRDGRRVIVANEDIGEASVWDIHTGNPVARATVSGEPEGVAIHPTRDLVYITCEEEGDVFALRIGDLSRAGLVRTGGRPRTVAFSPDGRHAYVPLETISAIALLDAEAHALLHVIPVPEPALPMGAAIAPDGSEVYVTTGRAGNSVVVLDTQTRAIVATIPVGTRPWGIGISPAGDRLFTANGGSNDVSVIDPRERRELARIPVGDGPWGIAVAAPRAR